MLISPVWVICALEEDEFSKFEKKLVRQFNAISTNEIAQFNTETHKWWKITNLPNKAEDFSNNLDKQGHPCDVPAFDTPVGSFDLFKFTVVFYAPANNFVRLIPIAEKLKQLQDKGGFMNGAMVIPYGLCVVTNGYDLPNALKTELSNLYEQQEGQPSEYRPALKKILFQGDQNKNSGNRQGYDALLDESDIECPRHFIHDLSVQIVSHLALARDNISLRTVNEDRLLTAGVYSLVFEKEAEKTRHASKIMKPLFKRFCSEESDERWLNDKEAVMTTDIKLKRDWKTVYRDLIFSYQDAEPKDLCPQSTDVSPWTLVSRYLIPLYFKKYIRSFINILHERVHDFSTNSFVSFSLSLDNEFAKLTRAHAPENEIRAELMSVWSKENANGALGIKQCQRLLEKTTKFYEAQKLAINNMKSGKAPDEKSTNFPGPNDFPMRKLGEYQESFDKYWRKNKNPKDKKTCSSDSYGNNLLEKLTKVLKYHPIPLSLLVRSILTGLSLPFAVLIILRLIPKGINTEVLEHGTGMWIMLGTIFALCILLGVFKYGKLVLGKIKSLASDYIGWYLYKTQKLMFEETLKKADNYYDFCLKVCKRYAKNLDSFIKAGVDIKDWQWDGYEQTMFQCAVTEKFDGFDKKKEGPRIIKDGTIVPKAVLTKKLYSRVKQEEKIINYDKEVDLEKLYAEITSSIINMDPDKDVIRFLEKGLFPDLPERDEEESQEKKDAKENEWSQLKLALFNLMRSKTRSSIKLCVGDDEVRTIADVAFIGEDAPRNLVNIRLQPSVQNNISPSPSAFASLVFPDANDSEKEEWNDCFIKFKTVEDIFDTRDSVSLASILMLVPVRSADDLKLTIRNGQ